MVDLNHNINEKDNSNMVDISSDKEKALNAAFDQINKKYGKKGEKAIMLLSEAPRRIERHTTGSMKVDIAIGGGLPKGRIIEIYGPESSGKTLLTLTMVAAQQRAGKVAAFVDAEHAFDPEWAARIGVDVDKLAFSQPNNGEQALEITELLVRSGAVDIIVVDSVAALTPQSELDGDMDQSSVGVQARMMSKAMRKITGAINESQCTVIFINQLREKIGVMFGCFHYNTRVQLADGTTEKIGKIVNQKMDVEVLSYNPETDTIEPRKIVNWFNNGKADKFLQFKVENSTGSGYAKFAATENHQISTPHGWESAGDLKVGDEVLVNNTKYFSEAQIDLIKASLLGDGCLGHKKSKNIRFRLGHGKEQVEYLDWKLSKLLNVPHSAYFNKKGAKFVDFTPTSELFSLWEEVYSPEGGKRNVKRFSKEYLRNITPEGWAVYLMDDGHFDFRTEGKQKRTAGGSGRVTFCVDAMTEESQKNLVSVLKDDLGIESNLNINSSGKATMSLTVEGTRKFLDMVSPYIHTSMRYKTFPSSVEFQDYEVEKVEPTKHLVSGRIAEIYEKPATKSPYKYDIEVEGNHNYFVDGVMVHNSPETTTGGKALKFYASIRLDVRRTGQLKEGTDVVGISTKVTVVKNKTAPPFKKAEYEVITEGEHVGIQLESEIRDLAFDNNLISKNGVFYKFGDKSIQGGAKAAQFLRENDDIREDLLAKLREIYFPEPKEDDDASEVVDTNTLDELPED